MYRHRIARILMLLLALMAGGSALAIELHFEEVLDTRALGDASFSDQFGRSVAIEGDTAAVGVPTDDVGPWDVAGSVYIFRRNQGVWQLTQKLVALQPTTFARFGTAVDMNGGRLVVGAPGDLFPSGLRSGAVHVYESVQGVWQPIARLTGATGATGDALGASVEIDGERIAASAPLADGSIADQGAVEIFRRVNGQWTQEQRLTPGQPGVTGFGRAIALHGDRLLLTHNGSVTGTGEVLAYVHALGNWGVHQVLAPSSPGAPFGSFSLEIDGTHALIGAVGSGGVYAFELNGGSWTATTLLQPVDGVVGGGFGRALALSGTRLLIGAPFAGAAPLAGSGKVYPFTWSGTQWVAGTPVQRTGARSGDNYGAALALSGDAAVIGAPMAEIELPTGVNSGLVDVLDWTSATPTTSAVLGAGLALDREGRYFGGGVDLLGDTAVVSAPWETSHIGNTSAGSVYVFRRNQGQWRATQRLSEDTDMALSESFGSSVVLSTDALFVGESGRDDDAVADAGAVHVYAESNGSYSLDTTLRASDPSSYAYFGHAVARSGNTLVVGAPTAQVGQMVHAGKAYVFELQNGSWIQVAAFSGSSQSGLFGMEVAIRNDFLAIGAPGYDASLDQASVHFFERTNGVWAATDVLVSSQVNGLNDQFGGVMTWLDDKLVIGAPYANVDGLAEAGRVDLFARVDGVWMHETSLTAKDIQAGANFGMCVAASGEHVVIGASSRGLDGGNDAYGALHLFRIQASSAIEIDAVLATDLMAGTRELGLSCSMDGSRLLVGAPLSEGSVPWGNPLEGTAYLFDVPPALFANGFE